MTRFKNRAVLVAALSVAAGLTQASKAASLYWDGNGSTTGSGNVGGTWDPTVANWSTDATGASATGVWTDGETAVFSAGTDGTGTFTVTLGSNITTPSIKVEELTNITLTGGTLTMGGGTIDASAITGTGKAFTIASTIEGAGGLTFKSFGDLSATGGGSSSLLRLSGTNTFTGDVTIDSGLVAYNGNEAFGAAGNKIILNGGGILDTNNNITLSRDLQVNAAGGVIRLYGATTGASLTGVVSGTGNITRTDGGTFTFTSTSSGVNYTGTLVGAQGATRIFSNDWQNTTFTQQSASSRLYFASNSSTNSFSAGVNPAIIDIKHLNAGADVFVDSASILNVRSGTINLDNARGFWIQPTVTATGGLTTDFGTLTLASSAVAALLTASDHQIRVPLVDYSGGNLLTVVKTGNGAAQLNVNSPYSGGTFINGGRLQGNAGSAFGGGLVTVASGAQAYLTAGAAAPFYNNFSITGDGVAETAGTLGALRLSGNSTVYGSVSTIGNTRITAYGSTGSIGGAIGGTGTVQFGSGVTGSSGNVVLFGSTTNLTGPVVVGSAGGSTEQLTLGDGTVAEADLTSAASLTVLNGGRLRFNRVYSATMSSVLPASVTFAGNNQFIFTNNAPGFTATTIDMNINQTTTAGLLRFEGASTTIASGVSITVGQVAGNNSTNANFGASAGYLDVPAGASLTSSFFNLGDGTNNAATIAQSGGTVTIAAGSSGIRIGHWNSGSLYSNYAITGGVLDASPISANSGTSAVINVGWDGGGSMSIGGGVGVATVIAPGIQIDANGDSAAFNDVLEVLPNGLLQVTNNIAAPTVGGLDYMALSGGTLQAVGTNAVTYSAPTLVTGSTSSTLDIAASKRVLMTGLLSGAGTLNVTGSGTLALNHVANTHTGDLIIGSSATLAGSGTTTSNAIIDGRVSPGSTGLIGSIATLGIAGASGVTTVNGGANFDLNATSTVTGNDLVAITGGLTFGTSSLVAPFFYGGTPTTGNVYPLFTYTGALTGVPTIDPAVSGVTRNIYAIDTATAGQVNLSVSFAGAMTLTWAGDSVANDWDLVGDANFTTGTPQQFYNGDTVLFDDTGSTSPTVNLTAPLLASAVNVNATVDYTFGGTGAIAGSSTLTKSGTGKLTLASNQSYTGLTTVNDGTLQLGTGGTTGMVGTGAVTLAATSATLVVDRSDNLTVTKLINGTGTLVKTGNNKLTLNQGGNLYLPNKINVNQGTLTLSGGGFSNNAMTGVGIVTVNSGAVLEILTAHALGGNNVANNGGDNEAVILNGGTLLMTREQYLRSVTMSGGTVTGPADLRSPDGANWVVTGSAPSTISTTGGMSQQNRNFSTTINVADVTGSSAADLLITSSPMVGSGGFTKTGAGTMAVSGTATNTFVGALAVNDGMIQLAPTIVNGLGRATSIDTSAVGVTTVTTPTSAPAGNTAIDLNGATVNEQITLNGGSLLNNNTTASATVGNSLVGIRWVNPASATAGFTGVPTVTFSGGGGTGAAATATTGTFVNSSTVTLIGATGGTISNFGSGYTSAPTVTLTSGSVTNTSGTVVVSSVVLNTGTTNFIGGAGTLNMSGAVRGTGGFTKSGNGALVLPHTNNSFTGDVTVAAGSINITGQSSTANANFALGSKVGTRTITVNSGASINMLTNNVVTGGGATLATLPTFVVKGTLDSNSYNAIGNVTLDGGTLSTSRTGTPGGYQGYQLLGTVAVAGSSTLASTISGANGWANHLFGTNEFAVSDATASSAPDLLVSAGLVNASADYGGIGSLNKTGAGTMRTTGTSTYTGSTTVNAGTLELNGSYTPTVASSTTLTVASAGNASVGGTANFFTVASPDSDVTVNGTLNIKSSAIGDTSTVKKLAGTGTVTVDKGSLNTPNGVRTAGLALTNGAVATIGVTDGDGAGPGVRGSVDGVTKVTSLSIDATSKLDLKNNGLIIPAAGNLNGSAITVDTLRAAILAGRGGAGTGAATWSGAGGIGTSVFAFDETYDSIGYVWSGDPNLLVPPTDINGESYDAGDYVVKYCAGADADLNGLVDDTDVAVIGLTYDGGATTGHHWYEGDFNYDGLVNDDDVAIIGLAYNPANTPLSPSFFAALSAEYGSGFASAFSAGAAGTVVPEPASLGLLAVGAMGLLRRRRK